jgi:CDP-glucose 4,6-dehydratase
MGVTPQFWKGKRVFVTGHTGFKGAWLILWLRKLGATVTGYALQPPTEPSLFTIASAAAGIRSITADIRDLQALAQALNEAKPEIVLHLAAQSLVHASYKDPVATFATNVLGTVNVLEASRQASGVRAIVNVTSDKCYENRGWQRGYGEDDAMGGHDPYSSSKGCAELVTAAFRRSFFSQPGSAALASARAGNVIGGGDWAADRLVPDIVRAIVAGRPVEIRNPAAVRPWQHVLEPLHGYLLLAERLYAEPQTFAAGWNFGPSENDARDVLWIVKRFVELWGPQAKWALDGKTHPHEAAYLKLDASRAQEKLKWRPVLDLDTALRWIVDWHRAHAKGEAMDRFTDTQIAKYQERIAL